MRQLSIKKPEGANRRALVANSDSKDINTATIKFKPFCTHCGEELVEDQFYVGGHGYVWALHCPNYSCPDKWPNGMPLTIDIPSDGGKAA